MHVLQVAGKLFIIGFVCNYSLCVLCELYDTNHWNNEKDGKINDSLLMEL